MNEKNPNQYNFEKKDVMVCSFCGRDYDKEEIKRLLSNQNDHIKICEICIARCNYLFRILKHKEIKVIPINYQKEFSELASDCFDTCKDKTCINGKCNKEEHKEE